MREPRRQILRARFHAPWSHHHQPMISFIVPAHNEQACLPRTLAAIHESARVVGPAYEIIVVDDASTDATAEMARSHHARVVSVAHRQIAATRNSGGRAAHGEHLFFVDADTTVNPHAIATALQYMNQGIVGGGAPTWIAHNAMVPRYIRLMMYCQVVVSKLAGFTVGAFMFCTRAAFQATGGFNEPLYWGKEGGFALALKREGRFVVLWKPVITSGRRFRKTSAGQLLAGFIGMIFSPVKMMTQRSSVEKVWYDSNRADDDKMPNELTAKLFNALALLIVVVLLTGPLWNFVPRSLTPLDSVPGQIRLAVGFLLSHVGLLFWPAAGVLFVNLLRQKRWTGLIQSAALIGICLWQAWVCTRNAIGIWSLLGQRLAQFFAG
jgi:glycosyltransferase involved in cell wall biosynthesis